MKTKTIIQSLLTALAIGVGWVFYARVYTLGIAFGASGLVGGVWFLPIFTAIAFQLRGKVHVPGLVLASEVSAAAISAAFGPLGWLSLYWGIAQGIAGEVAFGVRRSFGWAAVMAAAADLLLLLFHPAGAAARAEPFFNWLLHAIGLVLSAALLARCIEAIFVRRPSAQVV